MNILHLHQHFATRDGAGATGTYELAKHMIASGHTVTIVTANRQASGVAPKRVQQIDEITVISLGGYYSNHLRAGRRMLQFLRFMVKSALVRSRDLPHRPDVVLASSTPLTTGVSGWILARRFGVPLVFEVQDLWPRAPIELGYLRNPVLKWVAWQLERWC